MCTPQYWWCSGRDCRSGATVIDSGLKVEKRRVFDKVWCPAVLESCKIWREFLLNDPFAQLFFGGGPRDFSFCLQEALTIAYVIHAQNFLAKKFVRMCSFKVFPRETDGELRFF